MILLVDDDEPLFSRKCGPNRRISSARTLALTRLPVNMAKHPCPVEQRWPLKWGKPEMAPFDFGGFVTMKGGEFLFAPSLQFLKTL